MVGRSNFGSLMEEGQALCQGGLIITRVEVITVNRRAHLCSFMKHWNFGDPSLMIYFQLPRTNPSLQGIMTDQYINRYGKGVAYTIGGQQAVDEVQRNLMGRTKNALVS